MKDFLHNNQEYFYFAFRVIAGVLFFLHGIMKIQGIASGNIELMSLIGLAAIIETVGGAFLVIGLFTRTVAVISGLQMLVAYFMAHASANWNPLVNKGEAALLFLAAFLILAAHGSRIWSVDNLVAKRK